MKIKFVGTGSAKTSLNQFHSSLLISFKNYQLLIDAGDNISRALLFNKIDINQIDGIILTHLHPDHFAGLPSLIVQMKMQNREKPLDIFIHQSLVSVVKDTLFHSYILSERLKFEIRYKSFNDNEQIYVLNNFFFLSRENSHISKLQKYRLTYPSMSLYCASILFNVEDKRIIYTSDIGTAEDLFLFKEFSTDIFICEATHLEPSVLFKEIIKLETRNIYLTHYSDENLKKLSENLATLDDELKSKVTLANDGLSLEI